MSFKEVNDHAQLGWKVEDCKTFALFFLDSDVRHRNRADEVLPGNSRALRHVDPLAVVLLPDGLVRDVSLMSIVNNSLKLFCWSHMHRLDGEVVAETRERFGNCVYAPEKVPSKIM